MHFNSQPHKEADITPAMNSCQLSHFNSQPHKEADNVLVSSLHDCEYFNSQPHKEADEEAGGDEEMNNISTHSLTRRLTTSNICRSH